MVLYAHSLPSSPFENIISTFHVPVFIVITGYLIADKTFDKNETIERYKKTIGKNIVPYLFFSFISIFTGSLMAILLHDFSFFYILKNLYGVVTGYGGGFALWFVGSYLIGLAIYYLIRCNIQNRIIRWGIAFLSLILAMVYDYEIRGLVSLNCQPKLLFLVEYPIVSVLRSFTFTFYFEVGIWAKKYLERLSIKKVILISALFMSVIPISLWNNYTNYSLLNHGKYPFALYYCGAFGALGVITSFRIIYCKIRFRLLEFAGRHSLTIMSTVNAPYPVPG